MLAAKTHRSLEISQGFWQRFGQQAEVFRAPGRVNLMGEHTDYNQGFVLPAAIDLSCWAAVSPRDDGKLTICSEQFAEQVVVDIDALQNWPKEGWAAYPLGVAWSLRRSGVPLHGCNLYLSGDVPLGSGLSSSAAVEVATALALLHACGKALARMEIALLCQRAENEFVGARCGIMDQFIACHGKADHAVLLDCRSVEAKPIPIPAAVDLVVCNSMVKHQLAANEYNRRREECEMAVALLRKNLPEIAALRDVTVAQLETNKHVLPGQIHRRARHVVTENQRTIRAAEALQNGDLQPLRKWMAESHQSLRDDYQVSCVELDLLVQIASTQEGVLGARMTGGGFGGCTINLVKHEFVQSFAESVAEQYFNRANLRPEILIMKAAEGAGPAS